jgi:hypothetical protein
VSDTTTLAFSTSQTFKSNDFQAPEAQLLQLSKNMEIIVQQNLEMMEQF